MRVTSIAHERVLRPLDQTQGVGGCPWYTLACMCAPTHTHTHTYDMCRGPTMTHVNALALIDSIRHTYPATHTHTHTNPAPGYQHPTLSHTNTAMLAPRNVGRKAAESDPTLPANLAVHANGQKAETGVAHRATHGNALADHNTWHCGSCKFKQAMLQCMKPPNNQPCRNARPATQPAMQPAMHGIANCSAMKGNPETDPRQRCALLWSQRHQITNVSS